MTEEDTPQPLPRSVSVASIPPEGLRDRIEASPAERAAIAEILGLEALAELAFEFNLVRRGRERFAVDGLLQARMTQTCVVTLDPVERSVDLPIEAEFWPVDELRPSGGGREAALLDPGADSPEPIVDGLIDLGQLIYESLAAGLDPYPRKADAKFDWQDASRGAEPEDADGPFAALRRLKSD